MAKTVSEVLNQMAEIKDSVEVVKESVAADRAVLTDIVHPSVDKSTVDVNINKQGVLFELVTTFDQYVKEAAKTAIFPPAVKEIYPVLGVVDELMEYEEVKTVDEVGDIMWYLAACVSSLGVKLEVVEQDVYDLTKAKSVLIGRIKKFLRGDFPYEKYIEAITPQLNVIFSWAHASFGNLETIYNSNLHKLFNRMEKGKLQGDGGER